MSISRAEYYVNKVLFQLREMEPPKETDSEQYKRTYKGLQKRLKQNLDALDQAWYQYNRRIQNPFYH